jgi:hypothetical protein
MLCYGGANVMKRSCATVYGAGERHQQNYPAPAPPVKGRDPNQGRIYSIYIV